MKQLRVATWNIAGGRQVKSLNLFDYKLEDVNYFSKKLRDVDPDVVCIQEDHISEIRGVASEMARDLDIKHMLSVKMSPSHIDSSYFLGMTILSKFKLNKAVSKVLPYPKFKLLWKDGSEAHKHNKYIQIVKIGNLTVANFFVLPIQLWGHDYERGEGIKYARELENVLLELTSPLILCGDINVNQPELIYPNFFKKFSLSEALPNQITRPTKNENFENPDHILYSSEIKCLRGKVETTNTDHYLCWADFEIS